MALVESLLTAMVRADGDALVMHVGERPYVVASAGTLDLSTQSLNLDAMTGMLQQLLPSAARDSLEEFGAVEHRLPPHEKDTFTVVAARGGDDIWIEIRRRRHVVVAAVVAPAPAVAPLATEPPPAVEAVAAVTPPVAEPQPAAETVEPAAPVVAEPLPAVVMAADEEAVADPEPALSVDPGIAESAPQVEAAPNIETSSPAEAGAAVELPLLAEETVPAVEQPPAALVDELPPLDEMPVSHHLDATGDLPATESLQDVELISEQRWSQPAESQPLASASVAMDAAPPEMPVAVSALHVSEASPAHAAPVVLDAPSTLHVPQAPEPPIPAPVLQMTRTVRIEVPPRASANRGSDVERLLRLAASRAASALFVSSDTRPSIRVEGDIRPLDGEPPMTRAEVESAVMEIVPEAEQGAVGRGESAEWITDFAELGRVRCITFTDHRGPGAVFRLISTRAATAEQLGLSREVQALATEPQGLVLVTGRPGSGKSTLVSALVDLVNRQRAEYVVTLERQVRLVHDNQAAIVSQREIRGGMDEALTALQAALREDPDVLIVDDLTSAPMVPLLLQAASEGLVFVSIPAASTIEAVERFVDLAPADMRASVQAAMAETFRGAVAQVLLKKARGGRIAAREVLLATAAVTRVISEGAPGQLQATLEGGRPHGMVPLFDAVVGLVHSGVVDVREAFRKSPDRTQLLAGLKREGIDTTIVERLA